MKISPTKFVLAFLVSAFVFQFTSNSVLGPDVALFPGNGEWFPGTASSVPWKSIVSTIVYPIKLVLIAPLSPLLTDPDPPPPILVIAFSLYWTTIALALYYLLNKMVAHKKT